MQLPLSLRHLGVIVCGVTVTLTGLRDATGQQLPTVRERTRGLEQHYGFFPFYWEEGEGRLLLEVPDERLDTDFLYLTSLATGVGSLELGLDRGAIGTEAVVRFERTGPKVFLVQQNTAFRALQTENDMLVRSVEESFPTSILAAFEVIAEEEGRTLVDATTFFLRDAMDVRGRLKEVEQGAFSLDAERSTIHLPRTRAFPENTEVEATLTFASDDPGYEVRRHTPDGRSLTLRQHHSLVQLPAAGYEPRAFDPRVGLFAITFRDYARPLTERYPRKWIIRWRLQKQDPTAAISEPVEPIVYYLDRGIPEPYRSAFREGALWWNQVLEVAGFRNAFRVEDLPEGVDPMDARYSVIQWVHRTDPGYSIGPSFVDPRTGEIIKAAVRMDSYRSLVDYNMWAGMSTRALNEDDRSRWGYCDLAGRTVLPDWVAQLDERTDPVEFAMARRRQHAAHEVGHTLGLAHNFTASTYGRASVMDYPPPRVQLQDGRIDLSDAYRAGAGAYDSLAIRYAYTPFPDGEAAGLQAIVQEALDRELLFITDVHARPDGASDPRATLWDDGSESVSAFRHAMDVRRSLLANFGEHAVEPGEPVALLRDRLAPVYLHHRYALDAAVRTVGGLEIAYALRGDGQTPTRIIEPSRQRAALDALLDALEPEALLIPEDALAQMAPYPFGYASPRRGFESPAEPAFDQLAAARVLASMVVEGLLQRERAARLVAFAARRPDALTLDDVLTRLVDRTWATGALDHRSAPVRRVIQRVVLDALIELAADDEAIPDARALAEWHLEQLRTEIARRQTDDPMTRAHYVLASRDIRRFLNRVADATNATQPPPAPPGTPIGDGR